MILRCYPSDICVKSQADIAETRNFSAGCLYKKNANLDGKMPNQDGYFCSIVSLTGLW